MEKAKTHFFADLALSNLSAMRLLHKGGKLTQEDDWANVVEHCLTEAAAVEALAELINLPSDDIQALRRAALIHDWDKRLEIKPSDFSDKDIERAELLLEKVHADHSLVAATKETFIERALVQELSQFRERLLYFVDNMCEGSEIVSWRDRVDRAEAHRPFLNDDEKMTARLGRPYWEAERALSESIEEEILSRLGMSSESPEELSELIKNRIKTKMEEMLEKLKAFQVTHVSDERRGSPEKNEDMASWKEDEHFISLAMFDGSTTFGDIPYFEKIGKSPGRVAGETAKETHRVQPVQEDPRETLLAINQAFSKKTSEISGDVEQGLELFSAAGLIARFEKASRRVDYACLGDCRLIQIHDDGSCTWHTSDLIYPFEKLEIETAQSVCSERGISMQEALEQPEVQAIIRKNHIEVENNPDGAGYGMLKGTPLETIEPYIETGSFTLEPGDKLVLISDGMLPPAESIDEQRELTEEFLRTDGVRNLLSNTRELEEADNELLLPRLKQHDDATGLELDT